MPIERIKSGILNLDLCIQGGFEKNSAILISGGGGSGKSIFGVQFLLEGINKNDESNIYISFEENKEKFFRHMDQFGWNLEKLNKEGKFIFLRYEPEKIVKLVESGGEEIKKYIEELNSKRIVIDSLSAYTVLFDKESEQRKMLVRLFEMISSWGCTTVVIAEEDHYLNENRSSIMGFMADAILIFYTLNTLEDPSTLIRAMRIAKMRATRHTFGIFPYIISEKGITTHPDQTIKSVSGGN